MLTNYLWEAEDETEKKVTYNKLSRPFSSQKQNYFFFSFKRLFPKQRLFVITRLKETRKWFWFFTIFFVHTAHFQKKKKKKISLPFFHIIVWKKQKLNSFIYLFWFQNQKTHPNKLLLFLISFLSSS